MSEENPPNSKTNSTANGDCRPVPCSPFCGSDAEECDECDHGIVRVRLDFEDRALVSRLEDHAMTHDAYEAILFWAIGRIRFLEANNLLSRSPR